MKATGKAENAIDLSCTQASQASDMIREQREAGSDDEQMAFCEIPGASLSQDLPLGSGLVSGCCGTCV